LYVSTDSQTGLTSDYNNLFTTAAGKLGWYEKDFTDLYDWQVQTHLDTHSIGTTVLDPALDNPQFVNLAGDDYHLTDVVFNQHCRRRSGQCLQFGARAERRTDRARRLW